MQGGREKLGELIRKSIGGLGQEYIKNVYPGDTKAVLL